MIDRHIDSVKGKKNGRRSEKELDKRKVPFRYTNKKTKKNTKERFQSYWFVKGGAFWHYAIQQISSKKRRLQDTLTHTHTHTLILPYMNECTGEEWYKP